MRIEAVNFNGVDMDYVYVNGEQVIAPSSVNSHWVGWDNYLQALRFVYSEQEAVFILWGITDDMHDGWNCRGVGCDDCVASIRDVTGQHEMLLGICGEDSSDIWDFSFRGLRIGSTWVNWQQVDATLRDVAYGQVILHNDLTLIINGREIDSVSLPQMSEFADVPFSIATSAINNNVQVHLRPGSTATPRLWQTNLLRPPVPQQNIHHDFTDKV